MSKKEQVKKVLQEIVNLHDTHGGIVAVLHSKDYNYSPEDKVIHESYEQTTVVFSNGFTYDTNVFRIGSAEEEDLYSVFGLKKVVQMVPFYADKVEGDILTEYGTREQLRPFIENQKICYFSFRPIEDETINFSNFIGIWVYDEIVKKIAEIGFNQIFSSPEELIK